jgi:hypothetical protein
MEKMLNAAMGWIDLFSTVSIRIIDSMGFTAFKGLLVFALAFAVYAVMLRLRVNPYNVFSP